MAVPGSKWTISNLGSVHFPAIDFADLFDHFSFPNGRGPDVLHAWTPREVVRTFCEEARQKYGCRVFVHMEDNEWLLVSHLTNTPLKVLKSLPIDEVDRLVPRALSHPVRGYRFLESADAITIIIDRLAEIVPRGKPILELWPSAPAESFYPKQKIAAARRLLGVPVNSTLIVYTGNIHAVNASEMRSLYLAVALLNRAGTPTTLVRAGNEDVDFLGPGEQWARRYSIELGRVSHREVPDLLALADVFVQPGRPGDFNDYRFPSKLPEYFSIGRPVILPFSNMGRRIKHRKDAFVLPEASGAAIAEAVSEIMSDPTLYNALSEGAVRFFNKNLSWKLSAKRLAEFYSNVSSSN